MDMFYNPVLFHQTFALYGQHYKVCLQIFYDDENSHENYILGLLSITSRSPSYLIGGFAHETSTFHPINVWCLDGIEAILRDENINPEILSIISKANNYAKRHRVKPNTNLQIGLNQIAISPLENLQKSSGRIKLKIAPDFDVIPDMTCFWAIDGLNERLVCKVSIDKLDHSRLQEYHQLRNIPVFVAGKQFGCFLIEQVSQDNNMVIISLRGMGLYALDKTKDNQTYVEGVFPKQLLNFFIGMTDMRFNQIQVDNSLQDKQFRCFVVTIPIYNLTINNSFGVGCVSFVNAKEVSCEEFLKCIPAEEPHCFAKVNINDTNFCNAYKRGIAQIKQTIDFLVSTIRDDSIYKNHSLSPVIKNSNASYMLAKIYEGDWASINDIFYGGTIVFNAHRIYGDAALKLDAKLLANLSDIKPYEHLLIDLAFRYNEMTKPLFDALKWARKSWDTTDPEDKILYALIALEFAVANETALPLADKAERKLYVKCIKEKFGEIHSDLPADERTKRFDTISQAIHHELSDAPFRVKLCHLAERLGVPLSEEDFSLIKVARTKRNDIVHGRQSEPMATEDIWLLNQITMRIIYKELIVDGVENGNNRNK